MSFLRRTAIVVCIFVSLVSCVQRIQAATATENDPQELFFFFSSPSGGETFQAGQAITVQWVHDSVPPPTTIDSVNLLQGPVSTVPVVQVYSGEYVDSIVFTVPQDLASNYYSFEVYATNPKGVTVYGRTYTFAIQGVGPLPASGALEVLTPPNGALWVTSQTYLVRWALPGNTDVFPSQVMVTICTRPESPSTVTDSAAVSVSGADDPSCTEIATVIQDTAFFLDTKFSPSVNATPWQISNALQPGPGPFSSSSFINHSSRLSSFH